MAEQKAKQASTNSSNKRSHTGSKTDESDEPTKRPRIEYEQTGYSRGYIPEKLMGATDIYDGELMFLYVSFHLFFYCSMINENMFDQFQSQMERHQQTRTGSFTHRE